MSATSSIAVSRLLHVELGYHVLSHLDLGADAASIFRADRPAREWVAPLGAAYHAARGRLTVQALALLAENAVDMLARLRDPLSLGLGDRAGRRLAQTLSQALEAEIPPLLAHWRPAEADAPDSPQQTLEGMRPLLERLRGALWSPASPPPLRLYDCDALAIVDATGRAHATHGRALRLGGEHRLAVSFCAPRDQLLCQIVHEEIHPRSDPSVRRRFQTDADRERARAAPRDTRLGSDGFRFHRALEHAAIERGQRLLHEHAPELLSAYARWRARFTGTANRVPAQPAAGVGGASTPPRRLLGLPSSQNHFLPTRKFSSS